MRVGGILKRLAFYTAFYTILSAFFSALMAVFYQTLDPTAPKFQGNASCIGDPALGLYPNSPEIVADDGSPLVWYNQSDKQSLHVRDFNKFLSDYHNEASHQHILCSYERHPIDGEVCYVDLNDISPCLSADRTYSNSQTCVFLRLNKVYGWKPEVYKDLFELPKEMPLDLETHIGQLQLNQEQLETVWISCEGRAPVDKENIGPIAYLPQRGFPSYYFPFKSQYGYLSPFVAVHFQKPLHGVIINVECKLWAKNIKHDLSSMRGATRFSILIN